MSILNHEQLALQDYIHIYTHWQTFNQLLLIGNDFELLNHI